MTDNTEAKREARLRRAARRHEFNLHKSRVRNPHTNDHGGYQLVELRTNTVVDGANFDMTLDDVERHLAP
jgi:hypothetical protein